MYLPLAILAAFAFLYSIVAGRIEKTLISGPIVFVTFGILVGPMALGWLDLPITGKVLKVLADLTLAMLLFSDLATVNKANFKSISRIPFRMLSIGLPGTIALGFLVGWLMFDGLPVWSIAVLAMMLAATDAALGKAVITQKCVPEKLRTSLNVESGLNDGLCVPLLLLFITLSTAGGKDTEVSTLLAELLLAEIGIGVAAGLAITAAGYWLSHRAWKMGWITQLWGQLPIAMLALTCFAVAQSLGGSGYIASFVGGFLFGDLARKQSHKLVLDTEVVGETLGMVTWIFFGASIIPVVLAHFSWLAIAYALLSLTLIRLLPVMLSLIGTREPMESVCSWRGSGREALPASSLSCSS
jgi:NhaP-type Na+/H+ or K+/H+ antiporter